MKISKKQHSRSFPSLSDILIDLALFVRVQFCYLDTMEDHDKIGSQFTKQKAPKNILYSNQHYLEFIFWRLKREGFHNFHCEKSLFLAVQLNEYEIYSQLTVAGRTTSNEFENCCRFVIHSVREHDHPNCCHNQYWETAICNSYSKRRYAVLCHHLQNSNSLTSIPWINEMNVSIKFALGTNETEVYASRVLP